jgi:hypothetical protein
MAECPHPNDHIIATMNADGRVWECGICGDVLGVDPYEDMDPMSPQQEEE